jgi:hypothetical protein
MYSYYIMRQTVWNYHISSVAQSVICILEINHKRVNCGLGIIPVLWLNFNLQNERKIFSEGSHNNKLNCAEG